MASLFVANSDTGRNLFGTLQQINASGTLGDRWNYTIGQWQAVVADADAKIPLTEGSGQNQGRYTGGTGQLGSYTGLVVKSFHDDDIGGVVVGATVVSVVAGVEQREATTGDFGSLATQVRDLFVAQPVPADSIVNPGTLLTTSTYVAPDNAGIAAAAADAATAAAQATTAATQSTNAAADAAAAKTASQSVDGKLPADTSTRIGYLDVAISSRSSHSANDVFTALNNTVTVLIDDSLLMKTSQFVAPDNAGIAASAADAAAAKLASQSIDAKLTTTRADYLDNLSGGPVATLASVAGITAAKRSKIVLPAEYQLPTSGTKTIAILIYTYDESSALADADANPTVTAANAAGTPRNGNLGLVTKTGTGQYRVDYTLTAGVDQPEQINVFIDYLHGGKQMADVATMSLVDQVASDFTSADRTQLQTIYNKLPTTSYLVGTSQATGAVDLDAAVGDKTAFHANLSSVTTSLTAMPANVRAELAANPVPASNMRGTDGALLATSYVAPDNASIATIAIDVSTAKSEATSANTQATAAKLAAQSVDGKVPSDLTTKMGFVDAAISSRSTFNPSVDQVTLAAGHGLATATDVAAVKAKTDLLPTQPAAVSDIPSASEVAIQTDSVLSTAHGSGAWDAASDATAAKQDAILAAISGISPNYSSDQVYVADNRTWRLSSAYDTPSAENTVTVSVGSTQTFAMDFTDWLNPGTSITGVGPVTITPDDPSYPALTATDLLPAQDKRRAHFKISTPAKGVYRVSVTITTSDGNTLDGEGWLTVASIGA